MDHFNGDVLEQLAKHTSARPSPESLIDVWKLGGAMNRVGPTDTAFSKRDMPYMLGIEAN